MRYLITTKSLNSVIPCRSKVKCVKVIHSISPSGQCVQVNNNSKLHLIDCQSWSKWSYDGYESTIRLMGTALCLKAVGQELPPVLSNDCLRQQCAWKFVSNSKLHVAALDGQGKYLCLQKKSYTSEILTRSCICIEDDSDCRENPQIQQFKLILTNAN